MTDARAMPPRPERTARLHLAAGAVSIGLGILALAQPAAASFWGDVIVGLCVAGAGIVRLVQAALGRGRRPRWAAAALGAVYLAIGAALAVHVLLGTFVLTLLLIGLLAVAGVWRLWAGLRAQGGPWWPDMLVGAVSLGLAWIVWSAFPGSAFWTLGVVLGIELIAGGAGLILLGLARGRG